MVGKYIFTKSFLMLIWLIYWTTMLHSMRNPTKDNLDATSHMFAAILNDNEQDLIFALDKGANIQGLFAMKKDSNDTFTPLTLALRKRNFRLAHILIDRIPSINEVYRDGHTALSASALYADGQHVIFSNRFSGRYSGGWERIETKESLAFFCYVLEKDADINLPNKNGKTAIQMAVEQRLNQRVEILLERGADIYAHDNEGVSAFTLAYCKDPEPPVANICCFSAAKQLIQRKHMMLQKEKLQKLKQNPWLLTKMSLKET